MRFPSARLALALALVLQPSVLASTPRIERRPDAARAWPRPTWAGPASPRPAPAPSRAPGEAGRNG